ncbi:MAG: peptidylprolyl isomerase, partial [Deltaproteobacteria bacterium]
RASHLLVMYRGSERSPGTITRTRDEARARAQEALTRARRGDDFARLAGEFSDEPGAAARGGDLSRFGHGQMVPAFDQAAFALRVGQVSDLVETPFGFHVIKRTE